MQKAVSEPKRVKSALIYLPDFRHWGILVCTRRKAMESKSRPVAGIYVVCETGAWLCFRRAIGVVSNPSKVSLQDTSFITSSQARCLI